MAKLMKIENCYDCEDMIYYRKFGDSEQVPYCEKENRPIQEVDFTMFFPEWCPLPDAPEGA